MSDPDDEKADPQITPDMPPRGKHAADEDDDPQIEDPEIRSGHIGSDPA